MTPSDAPTYASAAHAARLIGRSERIVQLWMREAGHEGAWVPNAGYPTALLCAVVNAHKWPHQFALTPEHFLVDTGPTAIAADLDPQRPNENAAALAVLTDLHRSLASLTGELAAMRATIERLERDAALAHERSETAAQRALEGSRRQEKALERIEARQRPVHWWERIFGR